MSSHVIEARLSGRVVMVAGAVSDIGVEIARQCINEGAQVVCADINESAAKELAVSLGPNASSVFCDVSDAQSAREAVDAVRVQHGRLDGYVHNAAAPSSPGTVVELDPAEWHRELGVNLTGAFLMGKYVVPLMRPSGGSIVLIASQLGHVAVQGAVAYCAAKAGLIHLAKLMAVDHAGDGIRVNSLSPGAVRTSRLLRSWGSIENAQAALGPMHLRGTIGEPKEIGSAATFLLSDDASFVSGTDLLVDGGYTAR